jgi:hypothetical protein
LARNNQRRRTETKGSEAKETTTETDNTTSALPFVTPTELVDLPSEGRFYSEDHPLHNKKEVEIRYMTARDEDILTSQSLLKKGVALERFLENIVIDKRIKPSRLLVGDRNAILVAARITGYGPEYETKVICGNCSAKVNYSFDLQEMNVYRGTDTEDVDVTFTADSTFKTKLPLTGLEVEMRLLTGEDENLIAQKTTINKKRKILEGTLTSQLNRCMVSVNGDDSRETITQLISMLPARDSRHLRNVHRAVMPTVDLTQDFECPECSHEQEMEVPFTADFFWPKS